MRLYLRFWTCGTCRTDYRGADVMPAEIAQASFFYGSIGRPPWSKTDNPSPVTGVVCYCTPCVTPKEENDERTL